MNYVIAGIILIAILIIVSWYVHTYNELKRSGMKIEESLSGIDVALSKRYNVLTKMVEVVKGYTKHEKEVMLEVVKLRKGMNVKELLKANETMDNNLERINAVVENYPDLKASKNFLELQDAIIDVEEHLQAARRLYNSNVTYYNDLIVAFPSNIIAKMYKMTRKDYFKANKEEKDNVNIEL